MTELQDAGAPAIRDPYRIVLEVGTTLASSLDLEEVVQTIARQVGEALEVQWCDINEYDPEARTMTYVAVWSEELRGVDLEYIGTVVSLDDRPERDAVIRKGDLLEAVRRRRGPRPARARGDGPVRREGRHGDAAHVRRRDRWACSASSSRAATGASPTRRSSCCACSRGRRRRRSATRACSGSSRSRRAAWVPCWTPAGRSPRPWTSTRCSPASRGSPRRPWTPSYATVYEYRPHHDALVYRAEHSPGPPPPGVRDDALGAVYALADSPASGPSWRRPRRCRSTSRTPGCPTTGAGAMEAWRQKTCLSLPLRSGGATAGHPAAHDDRRRAAVHAATSCELLEALAESGGAAIHNARLFRAQQEESERLLELFDVSRRLTATFDRRSRRDRAGGGRREAARRRRRRPRVWLRDADGSPRDRAGAESAAAGELAQRGARRRPDRGVASPPSGPAWPSRWPSRTGSEGVMVVEAEGHRRFASGEREALQVLANQAAAALENERLYRRAEQEAIRDGLTGLYNHRHFQERLRQECRRSHRYGTPLSLLMLDLDDFKAFNDQFGHQIGDEALREVGQILFAVTRRGVDLCRALRRRGVRRHPSAHAGLRRCPSRARRRDGRSGSAAAGRRRRADRRRTHPRRHRRSRVPGARRPPLRAHHGHGGCGRPARRATTPRRSSRPPTRPSTRASAPAVIRWSRVAREPARARGAGMTRCAAGGAGARRRGLLHGGGRRRRRGAGPLVRGPLDVQRRRRHAGVPRVLVSRSGGRADRRLRGRGRRSGPEPRPAPPGAGGEVVERHVGRRALRRPTPRALAQAGFTSRIDVPLLAGAEVLGVLSLAETRAGTPALPGGARAAHDALSPGGRRLRAARLYEAESERAERLTGLLAPAAASRAALTARGDRRRGAGGGGRLVAGVACDAEVVLRQDDGTFARAGGPAGGAGGRAGAPTPWRGRRRTSGARSRRGRPTAVPGSCCRWRPQGARAATWSSRRRCAGRSARRRSSSPSLLAGQTGAALERARALPRAGEPRPPPTPLTGLYSRWYFYERLYAEVARARRYRQPLALVVGELDGEEELRAVARPGVQGRGARRAWRGCC